MISYNIPDHISGDTWDGIKEIGIQTNSIPANLDGAFIQMKVRLSIDSPTVLELNTDNGDIQILSPSLSSFSIPPRIVDIPTGNYIYAIKIDFSDGTSKTEVAGDWNIITTATKQ